MKFNFLKKLKIWLFVPYVLVKFDNGTFGVRKNWSKEFLGMREGLDTTWILPKHVNSHCQASEEKAKTILEKMLNKTKNHKLYYKSIY